MADRAGKVEKVEKSEAEWREELAPDEYRIMREKGTERPFTGEYHDTKDSGVYRCRACGTPLFSSETKYESGSGWPSFWEPVDDENVRTEEDRSLGMRRTEALCAACDAHLGHVFPDGPRPTGLRYCINSASLRLDREAPAGEDHGDAPSGEPGKEPAEERGEGDAAVRSGSARTQRDDGSAR